MKKILFIIIALSMLSCEKDETNDCLVGKITNIKETTTTSNSNQTITKTNLTVVDVCSGRSKDVTITLIDGMNVLFQPVDLQVGNVIEY